MSVKGKQKNLRSSNWWKDHLSGLSAESVLIKCLKAPQFQIGHMLYIYKKRGNPAPQHIKLFHTGTKLKPVLGVDKRLFSCRACARSCRSMLNKFSRPPTQNCYTTNNSQAQLQRIFHADVSVQVHTNMLRIFTVHGDYSRHRFRGHISGQAS